MSVYHVNQDWPAFQAANAEEIIFVDCTGAGDGLSIDTRDVLSDPAVADLLPGGLALWPQGAAFGTPDGEAPSMTSRIAGLTSALLAGFAALYAAAWRLTDESRSATLVDSLEDWEVEFGLPDPCVGAYQDEATRRRHLRAKVKGTATITPADVVRLAAEMGYVVALEEPSAFLAGVSTCGWYEEPTDTGLEMQWVVHLYNLPVDQFETGVHETGIDRLLDFDIDALACVLHRIKPAWTTLVVSVEPWPVFVPLIIDGGTMVFYAPGAPVLVPLLPD